jgi:hypothetical protein
VNTDTDTDTDADTGAAQYCEGAPVYDWSGAYEVLRPTASETVYLSDHFAARWKAEDNVSLSEAEVLVGIASLETSFDFYMNEVGFPPPYLDETPKYKVSVNLSDQGYATGAGTGDHDPEIIWMPLEPAVLGVFKRQILLSNYQRYVCPGAETRRGWIPQSRPAQQYREQHGMEHGEASVSSGRSPFQEQFQTMLSWADSPLWTTASYATMRSSRR